MHMNDPGDVFKRLNEDPAFSKAYEWVESNPKPSIGHYHIGNLAYQASIKRALQIFPSIPEGYHNEEGFRLLKEAVRGYSTVASLTTPDYTPEEIEEERAEALGMVDDDEWEEGEEEDF